jgi:hypothetical protein
MACLLLCFGQHLFGELFQSPIRSRRPLNATATALQSPLRSQGPLKMSNSSLAAQNYIFWHSITQFTAHEDFFIIPPLFLKFLFFKKWPLGKFKIHMQGVVIFQARNNTSRILSA